MIENYFQEDELFDMSLLIAREAQKLEHNTLQFEYYHRLANKITYLYNHKMYVINEEK
jgi:hypothetical protein